MNKEKVASIVILIVLLLFVILGALLVIINRYNNSLLRKAPRAQSMESEINSLNLGEVDSYFNDIDKDIRSLQ